MKSLAVVIAERDFMTAWESEKMAQQELQRAERKLKVAQDMRIWLGTQLDKILAQEKGKEFIK